MKVLFGNAAVIGLCLSQAKKEGLTSHVSALYQELYQLSLKNVYSPCFQIKTQRILSSTVNHYDHSETSRKANLGSCQTLNKDYQESRQMWPISFVICRTLAVIGLSFLFFLIRVTEDVHPMKRVILFHM
ncbi:hypothetical protein GDO78_014668 [Eleutherodactylus coqui]|uniref:Uncharacterized protein n=1 Tax=Eleutherodactylus coqui TaxID=57060 RepID=A0A8J6B2Y2_ELECQ|nr:hypothetical protein GDO78_014668 [Eleutherodactylus coqui]